MRQLITCLALLFFLSGCSGGNQTDEALSGHPLLLYVNDSLKAVEVSMFRTDSIRGQPELIQVYSEQSDIDNMKEWITGTTSPATSIPPSVQSVYLYKFIYQGRNDIDEQKILAYAKDGNNNAFIHPVSDEALSQLNRFDTFEEQDVPAIISGIGEDGWYKVDAFISNAEITSSIGATSMEDLNVKYNGLLLNSHTPLEELSTQLAIPIGEIDESIEPVIYVSTQGADDYAWYQVFFPAKDNADFILDYLYNETRQTGRVVSVDLKKVPTRRGVSVGDHLDQLLRAYGNGLQEEYSTETQDRYSFQISGQEMYFIVDKSSGEILEIYLDYGRNQAMKEIDVTSLVD